jgi:hypothetical protein
MFLFVPLASTDFSCDVQRDGGFWPGANGVKLEFSSSHMEGDELVSLFLIRVIINESRTRSFKSLSDWYLIDVFHLNFRKCAY